ncbi:MAG: hypothetical protein J6R47_01140 [Acholeplasmatales bacterium]|nr:hypothetical protein [Acholeplasmatales bacterium]
MEEINFTKFEIEESGFKDYEAKREKFENMMHDYRVSLIALGYDPTGKDLIEVITFLANTLNNAMCTLQYHKYKIEDNYIESLAGRVYD